MDKITKIKWSILTAVGIALLLIPRRSSRQTESLSKNQPIKNDKNTDKNSDNSIDTGKDNKNSER